MSDTIKAAIVATAKGPHDDGADPASDGLDGAEAMAEADALAAANAAGRTADGDHEYILRLYVAGHTAKSLAALANLKSVCEEHLPGRYRIEVVDLLLNPQLAAGDQILAVPTLVRRLPQPIKRLIGNLANTERVLVGLDLRPGET